MAVGGGALRRTSVSRAPSGRPSAVVRDYGIIQDDGKVPHAPYPYGDGTSGKKITEILQEILRGGYRPLAESHKGRKV